MVGSDVYVRGRLLNDCELVVFGSTAERDNAVQLLQDAGYSVRSNPAMVALIDDFSKISKYLKRYFLKPLVFGISRSNDKRSNRQLRFYFGVIIHGIRTFWKETTGEDYTKEQIHLDNLLNIYGWKPVEEVIAGRTVIRIDKAPSTGDMTVEDFTGFIRKIELEYAEKGLDWTRYIDEGDGTLNQYYEKRYGS